MIIIKNVTCKNFLSYGNAPTSFSLNTHKATLIRGKNGHGKSAWMDLIIYALYGKPYRDIAKPQLINSINHSGMLVEIDFEINGIQYKVVRGQKPNVFDIFKDGRLIEQDAASRDYQAYLESHILKISEKTFKQIAVLGSASYIPFMQLNAAQRRELVESILDIEVFSRMNQLLKLRIAATKEEASSISHKVDLKKTEAMAQQKLIKVMQENTKSQVSLYEAKLEQLNTELSDCESEYNLKTLEIEEHKQHAVQFDTVEWETLNTNISGANKDIKSLEKKIKDIAHIESCPTCFQEVGSAHVESVGAKFRSQIERCKTNLTVWTNELDTLSSIRDAAYTHEKETNRLESERSEILRNKTSLLKRINEIQETISTVLENTDDVVKEQEKLKAIGEAAMKLINRKSELSEEKHLQDVASQLLKDTGIKTAVVKDYLPVLNQLINKYLAMFDFFVDFSLDESFNEVIKSRGRDVFSYSSFSEGEKRRIDFAILMSFRQLAALKNSAKTNVLIFDEIVDGAFDLEARQQFNDLLGSIPNSNVIVISHADASTEAYDRVVHVEKRGDFSTYSVVE